MRRVLKLAGFAAVTLTLLLVAALLAFYHLVNAGEIRRFLIDEIERHTALKVELGEAELEVGWITGLSFRDLSITEPGAGQPALRAESVMARVALRPLLERRLIFYEIRLQKPTAQLAADSEGRIPLLDKLLNLPFLRQPDRNFQLDLRAVNVHNGAIDYSDEGREGGIGAWRLRNAQIALARAHAQRLRDWAPETLRPETAQAGAALQFSFRGAVETGGDSMNVRADGRLLFPTESLEFHQARWIADLELVELPAALVRRHAAIGLPIRSMSGHFGQRVHVDGNPNRQWSLRGDMEFRQLSVDAPEILSAPVARADGRVAFDLDWHPERLQLKRIDFRSGEIKFVLQGEVLGLKSADPEYRLTLTGLSAPLSVLRHYIPVKIAPWPVLQRAVEGAEAGHVQVHKGGVRATLKDLKGLTETGVGNRIWFDAEFRDVAGRVAETDLAPLKGVQGQIALENGVLRFRHLRGSIGNSKLTALNGSYHVMFPAGGRLEMRAVGDVDLAELRSHLTKPGFPAPVTRFAAEVREVAGRGQMDLNIKMAADFPVQLDGRVALDSARLRYREYELSDIKGEIRLSPKEIRTSTIRALLRGSPVEGQLTVSGYAADDAAFDLRVESGGVRAGIVTSLLLDTGSLDDPGIVRGAVRYRGPLLQTQGRLFTGDLDLVNVQLELELLKQPLRGLNGRIKIDEAGIDFVDIKATLVGFAASANGRWRYRANPQLLFDFAAPNLDVTYLISQIDPEASEFYARLQALGRITLGRGRLKNFAFSDLRTDVSIDRRVWRLTNLSARSGGGVIHGGTTIIDKPQTLAVLAEPKIQAVPIDTFLKWFNMTNTEMTGTVTLDGKLETVGASDAERTRNLNGFFNLRIEDGTIHRMRLLVQILNLLDLSRWFTLQLPDLAKDGIRFRSITGDFAVERGVIATENLVVDSNDLRMTGGGKIDLARDQIDFVVAVRPFAGIDAAIHQIPILGRGIAAIKNSFLVASFNISGKLDEPTITPAPLGTLSEMFWSVLGLPKSILGMGAPERKGEAPQTPKTPAGK